jgi:hypothetical protein
MSATIRVRVQAISPDRLSLSLPNGEQIGIPRTAKDNFDHFTVGDEVTLTITRSVDLLNELLTNHEEPRDNTAE